MSALPVMRQKPAINQIDHKKERDTEHDRTNEIGHCAVANKEPRGEAFSHLRPNPGSEAPCLVQRNRCLQGRLRSPPGPPPAWRDNTSMDRIRLEGMVFDGHHGVSVAERSKPQPFTVDIEVEADLHPAGANDQIEDTIDYRKLRHAAQQVITGESAHLIESLAERIAARALEIDGVIAVAVRVAKRPSSMEPLDAAAVEIKRTRG